MPKKSSKKQITTFRKRVYKVVSKIQQGKVLTYKEVARLTGNPRAWRAVGNALNKNPDLHRIPCHRVVKSDGAIGGYRGGVEKKIFLLKKEGLTVSNGKVKIQ